MRDREEIPTPYPAATQSNNISKELTCWTFGLSVDDMEDRYWSSEGEYSAFHRNTECSLSSSILIDCCRSSGYRSGVARAVASNQIERLFSEESLTCFRE